jgi:hypothetical protein
LLRWPASERLRPQERRTTSSKSIEDINNYLLQHKDVIDYIERRGGDPAATFLMFDEKTEELAKELGMESGFRRPSCASVATTRWKPYASATRPACRRYRTCWRR